MRKKNKPRKIRADLCVEEVSEDLATYLTDRSALEKVSFTLNAAFFARHLRNGVVSFLGVETGFNDSGELQMIRDLNELYEGYFDEWMIARGSGLSIKCLEVGRESSLSSSNKLSNKENYHGQAAQ